MRRICFKVACVWCLSACWPLSAGSFLWAEEPPAPELPVLSEDVATRGIMELNSNDFSARESATEALRSISLDSVDELAAHVSGEDLEFGLRAIEILESLYIRALKLDDTDRAIAIYEKLQMLRDDPRSAVSQRVVRIDHVFERQHEKSALVRLSQLGALIGPYSDGLRQNRTRNRLEQTATYSVVLGKKWTGGEAGLELMSEVDGIRMIYIIDGANLPPGGREFLQMSMPRVHIDTRSPARLGVSNRVGWANDACVISEVSANSAAAEAGMRPGDNVIKFGPDPIASFNDLVDAIKKYAPGEEVDALVIRDQQPMTLKVRLKGWADSPLK